MSKVPFDPHEFDIVGTIKSGSMQFKMSAGAKDVPDREPVYNRPVTDRENWKLWFDKKSPYWLPYGGWLNNDITIFRPRMYADNYAIHSVFDGEPVPEYEDPITNTGLFGLQWVFVPVVGGATVKPGAPVFTDMNDWRSSTVMPDAADFDWEHCIAANKEYLDNPRMNQLGILTGLWERLMSLMDVDNAAVALIDDEQEDALRDFFQAYTDFFIDYIRRMKENFPIDCVLIHDDWGHQRSSFFSLDVAMDKLMPYYKQIIDVVHSLGMYFELHCCGKAQDLVPAMIAAGVDMWCPQPMNDIMMLAEKYKDVPITFGLQSCPVDPQAPEEELRKQARDWFDSVKEYRIINTSRATPPAALQEIYKASREYYLNR